MHKPGLLKLSIVCDTNTLEWAKVIRSYAELATFRVNLHVLFWEANLIDFLAENETADVTNYTICIDTNETDANQNRKMIMINEYLNQIEKCKTGVIVNLGCFCFEKEYNRRLSELGYKRIIGNPGSETTFVKAVAWVVLFLNNIVERSLRNQQTVKNIDFNEIHIEESVCFANRTFLEEESVFILS